MCSPSQPGGHAAHAQSQGPVGSQSHSQGKLDAAKLLMPKECAFAAVSKGSKGYQHEARAKADRGSEHPQYVPADHRGRRCPTLATAVTTTPGAPSVLGVSVPCGTGRQANPKLAPDDSTIPSPWFRMSGRTYRLGHSPPAKAVPIRHPKTRLSDSSDDPFLIMSCLITGFSQLLIK